MKKKRSLGQHFLHNQHYLGRIAGAAEIKKGEMVVEVGPGDGALTEVLVTRGAEVLAIEKDHRLISLLREKFKNHRFEVKEGDALTYAPKHKPYKVVGNIPYYITGALLKKFLTAHKQPSLLVFLMQKEVAHRIARSTKESILSLSVKAYGDPRIVSAVPRGVFVPAPKVDSAILQVKNISRKNFTNAAHERKFFELLHKGFGSKRKLLKSNLRLDVEKFGVASNARAEDVPLHKWLELAKG